MSYEEDGSSKGGRRRGEEGEGKEEEDDEERVDEEEDDEVEEVSMRREKGVGMGRRSFRDNSNRGRREEREKRRRLKMGRGMLERIEVVKEGKGEKMEEFY